MTTLGGKALIVVVPVRREKALTQAGACTYAGDWGVGHLGASLCEAQQRTQSDREQYSALRSSQ